VSAWQSWGRLAARDPARVSSPQSVHESLVLPQDLPALPFGRGRSYGDVCLNGGGVLLHTARLDRFIAFDRATGVLRCESGVSLRDILDLVVPQGWFLAVTPGTREVSVGGAIANDVHGKNHHAAGSFGHHLRGFELLRSSGERLLCTRASNPEWFAATLGGLGLTGLITWAELQLAPIGNAFMQVRTRRFQSLDAFWELNAAMEPHWPYTVAWIDCVASGRARGRGVFMAARHAAPQRGLPAWRERRRAVPLVPPFSLVNALSLRGFNQLYWHRAREGDALQHYVPYFYPLDALAHWNRIYGRRGFYQYQCVVPPACMRDAMAELLRRIARSGQGSFLAVLKTFGSLPSLGLLSFARPGATLALDFPNRGQATLRLFEQLDAVVREAGGAIYAAKDARMPPSMFRLGYPRAQEFSRFVDPRFGSDFWRRVSA
jgi:FAD/FMN-containing dehydrogenase